MYKGFGLAEAQALFDGYATPQSERKLRALVGSSPGLNSHSVDLNDVRSFVNELVMRCYPNERTIKASFVDGVILKQSPRAVSIFELPVGGSRADLCKVNGSSSVYEIKTDLDSFYRLEKQLADYFAVFDYVNVVVSDARWRKLPDYVPEACGIYTYRLNRNGRYSFTLRRKAQLNYHHDCRKQLSTMPKRNLATISGLDSRQSKNDLIDQCLARYGQRKINELFKSYLKERYGKRWAYFKSVQPQIFEIDYEWFYHNNLDPAYIY